MKTALDASSKIDILIVDDKSENLQVLSALLTQQGYSVRGVVSGAMALRAIQSAPPHLILLDIMMPEMDGYDVCRQLKTDPQTEAIPIIFISALDEVFDKVQAFKNGGVDYITKPFQWEEVLARVRTHLSLFAAHTALSELNSKLELRILQRTAQLEAETAQRYEVQQELLHLALHDPLTGLPNRTCFSNLLAQALDHAQQQQHYRFAVLYLDCDRFKMVNDSLGHSLGDRLLVAVAKRLNACLQSAGQLARLGGDEFAILLEDISDKMEAIRLAEKLNRALSELYTIEQHEIFMNACIGIVIGDGRYEQPEHLLRDADTAMYRAKSLGTGRFEIFDDAMHLQARQQLQIEINLRRATERRDEFSIYYQPIVSIKTSQITGFEALIRWPQANGQIILPEIFIQIAEETDLIVPIDLWVIQQAYRQLRTWASRFPDLAPLVMSVNLSAKHFLPENQPKLLSVIDDILSQQQSLEHQLKLEITESTIVHDPEGTIRFLHKLRKRNVQLSIDDFGTGYSSLSYLHRFPVNTLKIDRQFVKQVQAPGQECDIIKTITALGHQLGLSLVAEGVETQAQLDYLSTTHCQEVQGYLFSPPVPTAQATELLIAQQERLKQLSVF
ncbi:EAL domain-containing protein [Altericista sp. CCNU0014]|uniref:EAL domain-containing response regulator n=1 Tax=Altericista sp. CCNU0014 TaxID=3082949 RepID=UPI00384FF192